jgi:predicted anti-sigma-YlaC factor YlaD
MNEMNCENVLMAKMAELDGEATESFIEIIDSHLSVCKSCRVEFERMQGTDNLFKRQARREQEANLWSAIKERIIPQTTSPINWKPFVLLGVILVCYKLLEMLPAQDFGLAFKIVPLIFVTALFVFLKKNPFKISAELGSKR